MVSSRSGKWLATMGVAVLALTLFAGPVLAGGPHGGHGGFHGPRGHFHGRFFGPRFFVGPRFYPFYGYAYPYYYPPYYPPYYYAPPPVVVTPPPTEYVERPSATGYWYYCHDPAGYYPTVGSCPGGWTQVAPRSE